MNFEGLARLIHKVCADTPKINVVTDVLVSGERNPKATIRVVTPDGSVVSIEVKQIVKGI